jgi:hypothetical protein
MKVPGAERSKLFLKLLLLCFKEAFHFKPIKAKGARTFEKLSNTPQPKDIFAEVEIIPYEHLWEFILEVLSGKSHP